MTNFTFHRGKIGEMYTSDEISSFASRINPHAPKSKILPDYVPLMYLEGGYTMRINAQSLF